MKSNHQWLSPAARLDVSGTLALPHEQATQETEAAHIAAEVTQLFEELQTPVLRYLLSIGLTAADADEVSQEAFLALFGHLRQGRPRTNLRGWIFRVAHNQGLKRRHAGQRRRVREADTWTDQIACGELDPEQRLRLKRKHARTLTIVAALPQRDQYCLRLRAEGLRYREIARVLGISLGAVSLSVERSLVRLRSVDE